MSDAVKESVVGVLDGIEEKPTGWTDIKVRVDGWEYPVKMSTKLQPLIELARAAGTETMTWHFKKQESDQINEKSGKPFVNRYFEGVEKVEISSSRPPVLGGDKDRLIVRQTCLKAAAALGAIGEDPALETMKMAQRFETWVYRDMDDTPF